MAVSVVSFSFCWCSTEGPGVHSARWWLSLLHLINILSGPQLIRAPSPFGIVWLSFPTSRLSPSPTLTGTVTSVLTELYNSSRPLSRQLDLWNRMLDRHQAEITVMQLTGHSLLVHQSMSVPWEFFTSSYFISQFPPTRFPFITAIRMCHFLPVHHSEWHFWPVWRSKCHMCSLGVYFSATITPKHRETEKFLNTPAFKCFSLSQEKDLVSLWSRHVSIKQQIVWMDFILKSNMFLWIGKTNKL